MMTNCPTCGKPVDTLRARAVSVRDGKVIAFCSLECKAAAETKPVVMPVAAKAPEPAAVVKRAPTPAPIAAEPTKPDKPDKKKKKVGTDTDPVIEIVHEPASGVVTSAPDRRDVRSTATQSASASTAGSTTIPNERPAEKSKKSSPKASDGKATPIAGFNLQEFKNHEPDEAGKPAPLDDVDADDEELAPPAKRGRGMTIAVVVILLLGGGAILVYKLMNANAATLEAPQPDAASRNTAARLETPDPTPAQPPAETASQAVDRATTILRKQLTSTPKIALAAAAALARTHDKAALEILAKQLPQQSSDIGRLQVAYQLARSGETRGKDALIADLGVESRERRMEAARLLERLGEPRATQALGNYIEYTQYRMSIAVLLAEVKDAKALKVLDEIVADPKATVDDKARATIALAVAGRPDLTDKLHGYLGDNRFNTEAAMALARLHDAAARPVLVQQLAVSSLRVGAARALRMLEPGLDATPLLPALLAELDGKKDTEQVLAAEAIMILAGDASWSQYE